MYVPKMTTYSPNIYVFVYDVPPMPPGIVIGPMQGLFPLPAAAASFVTVKTLFRHRYSTAVNLFQKFQVILFTPSRHHNGLFTLEEEELWAEGGEPPAGRSER
jgi:hypothetical protein